MEKPNKPYGKRIIRSRIQNRFNDVVAQLRIEKVLHIAGKYENEEPIMMVLVEPKEYMNLLKCKDAVTKMKADLKNAHNEILINKEVDEIVKFAKQLENEINYDGMKEQMIKHCSDVRLGDINEESFWQYSTFLRRVAKEEPLTDELGCPSNFGADLNVYPVYGRDDNGIPHDGMCYVKNIVKDLPGQPLQMEQCAQCWLMMTNKVYNKGE